MKHNKVNKKELTNALNDLLANEYVLYTKTLKYHWNIESPHFFGLHKMFDDHYHDLLDIIDAVAERVRALRGIALGTLTEFLKQSTVKEKPGNNPHDQGMIKDLHDDHEVIINVIISIVDLANKLNDEGTISFLGGLLEKHEKMAWMLRAHLVKK